MKVGIIVVSWNGSKLIGHCLRGLLQHEKGPVYVVDNGSEDGTAQLVADQFPTVTLIRNTANLGFGGGNNVGIRRALGDGCDAVFLLNQDTVVDRPFVEECLNLIHRHPDAGIVGPAVVDAIRPDRVQSAGGRIRTWSLRFPYRRAGEKYRPQLGDEKVDYVVGAAMMITSATIARIGLLDPEFFPAYVEEADLAFRARQVGVTSWVTHATRVRHIGHQSAGPKKLERARMARNRLYFAAKHFGPIKRTVGLVSIGISLLRISGRGT